MAERPEHQRILGVLASLDAEFLREAECWFAGGTAISLRCNEFRVSRDVDFLCASRDGYRLLRERVFHAGIQGIFRQEVAVRREVRADRYGVRVVLDVGGMPLPFEIVSEGRIDLAGTEDGALPVARLADEDLVAEKLLANQDRYLDDATLGRDLIDLVLLEHALGGLPEAAREKARRAYGPSVDVAFERALRKMSEDAAWRERAFERLAISAEARAIVDGRLGVIS